MLCPLQNTTIYQIPHMGYDYQALNTDMISLTGPRSQNIPGTNACHPGTGKRVFQLRGQENRSGDFVYPALTYTINPADLMPPK